MEATILTATPEQAGQRLDAFLAQALPELTRSAAQRLIAEGLVTVDGKAPAKSLKLSGGETVAVTVPEPEEAQALPEDIPALPHEEEAYQVTLRELSRRAGN